MLLLWLAAEKPMKRLLAQPASEGRTVHTHAMLLEDTCSLKGQQLFFLRSIDIDKLARQPCHCLVVKTRSPKSAALRLPQSQLLDGVGVLSSMAYKHPTPLLGKNCFADETNGMLFRATLLSLEPEDSVVLSSRYA